jgi:hypothetical protein
MYVCTLYAAALQMDGSDDAMVTIYTHTTLHTHGMLADFVPTSFNRNANAAASSPLLLLLLLLLLLRLRVQL